MLLHLYRKIKNLGHALSYRYYEAKACYFPTHKIIEKLFFLPEMAENSCRDLEV